MRVFESEPLAKETKSGIVRIRGFSSGRGERRRAPLSGQVPASLRRRKVVRGAAYVFRKAAQ
jgi:hypothetical protein